MDWAIEGKQQNDNGPLYNIFSVFCFTYVSYCMENVVNLIKKILAFIFKDPRRKDATTKVSAVGSKTK